MKHITIAVIAVLLWISHVSAQTQPVVTGSAIPDAAAWRIWLNMKSEVPVTHSEAFTTYLISLGLSSGDAAVLQAALESYATKATGLITMANAKIDAADDKSDAVTASNLQTSLQTQLAALVSATQTQLGLKLSVNGASFLTDFIQNEKRHMAISPTDVALAETRPMIYAEPVVYHSGHPQGTQMNFNYSLYASSWLSVAGMNSSGDPYGTFYQQLGAEGLTSPCFGYCTSAIHTAVTQYNHSAGGVQQYTVASQHANTYMEGQYTYAWPFDTDNNFFWPGETAFVSISCSYVGNFLGSNPISPQSGTSPFQSETATTYTTTLGQKVYTCTIQTGCSGDETVVNYCYLAPDYSPEEYANYSLAYGASLLEFRQYAACERPTSGGAWSCAPFHSADQMYSDYLVPPGGGANCSHHP